MKHLFLAALALLIFSLTFSADSNAQVGPNPGIPTRPEIDPSWPPRKEWPRDDYPNRARVECANEVVEGNVKATDRVLKNLAASSDFASAKSFRAQVSKISKQKQAGNKATQYLALAGIDANNSEAVVEFIGARDIKGQWLSSLEKNSGLTSEQAEVVASKLQNTLRGSLQ